MKRSTLVRGAIFLATVAASGALLSLGTAEVQPELEIGELTERAYEAGRTETIVDVEATEALEQAARDSVAPPRRTDPEIEATVISDVLAVFDDLQTLAVGDTSGGPEAQIPELPEQEEPTEAASEDSTTTTEAPPTALLMGSLYIDVDEDDTFNPEAEAERVDAGIGSVTVEVRTYEGTEAIMTDQQGVWTYEYAGGPAVVVVDTDDSDIPRGYVIAGDNTGQLVECLPGETCQAQNVGFQVQLRSIEEVVESVTVEHGLDEESVTYLAETAADDIVRNALGLPLHLPTIQEVADDQARLELGGRIEPEELRDVQASVTANPPLVFHEDTLRDSAGAAAAAEIVASNLQANYLIDEEEWTRLQEEAAGEVESVEKQYTEGQEIIGANQPLSALDIAAIVATSNPTLQEQPEAGLMAVLVVLVTLIGVYLATFRPEFWSRPRMVSLLGIMIVLAAASVRATVAAQGAMESAPGDPGWYVLPAVAFGFVTAVLFDQRIAMLMALAVGVLTAVGTLDTGVTVYGILAALAPIPFVSAVSTRGSFRDAVILSSLVAAGVAAATSWFFHIGPNDADQLLEVIGLSVVWAFGVSVVASLLGLAALQFFESAFDITTTLGLLDLTDRNHKALQMLQDKAFGTFNHSLMVGTLADAAARSIGANALLARAMAYYHDLGKTENPTFFIENQFGIPNPHDLLDPRESAEILRSHVTSGVALARQYKIPTEVTEGIVSHHGDGVMRYFYEKARQDQGVDVDIDDFRHIGHKPRTAETAILMLADSLEAACRANFQSAEPTPDAIEKVVDRVMDEKLEDGQLSESPLTLGQISRIRQAFLESLVGHYHQRIAYPNFPGS